MTTCPLGETSTHPTPPQREREGGGWREGGWGVFVLACVLLVTYMCQLSIRRPFPGVWGVTLLAQSALKLHDDASGSHFVATNS